MSDKPIHTKFMRSSKRLLIAVLSWNVLALVIVGYRFTLPTDGWFVTEPEDFITPGLIFQQNIMGVESGLQVGDRVTAVNNVPIITSNVFMSSSVREAWQLDNTLHYTIQRGAETIIIDVPLVEWRIDRFIQETYLSDLNLLVDMLGLFVFVCISYYTFWQRLDSAAAKALFVLAASLLNIFLVIDMAGRSLVDLVNPVISFLSVVVIFFTFTLLLPPAFIRFGLVFPRPKPIIKKYPWLIYTPYLVGLLVVIAFIMDIFVLGWIWTGTAVLISILLLIHNAFTMRDSVSQGQLRWALGGTIIGFSFFLLTYVNVFFVESSNSPLGQLFSALSGVGFTVMGIGLAVAILRYHLFDIDLIVNRALVYGGLSLSVITIYVLIVGYLSFLLQTEANLGISLVATGIVAVLFGHMRNWLQRGVNRLMYGQRDEPYKLLTRLGQQLETALNPASALSLAVEMIALALKLPYVAISLQRGEGKQITAVYGNLQNEIESFPLIYIGQPIGELLVAARTPNELLTPADHRLLTDLARQISVTAHAHLLSINLEQARLRLVTERGEARRQLGSDLHDGVGHQLVGLTRQLERARTIASDDSASAQKQLAEINQQLVALTKHVRNLAHQLYPPELELLGLVGAIQEHAQTNASFPIRLDIQGNMPPLPAEIETAVYYITLEALTNIEKHAQAHSCTIHLCLSTTSQPAHLELAVRDDGTGLPTNLNGGLGTLSMQARAAEVGGICTISNQAGGGTAVTVTIPCPVKIE